jgi:hypothetical protein
MKNSFACILLLLSLPGWAADTTKSPTQYGITWEFANPVTFGQYINGDYWVVGPVELVLV